MNEELFNNIKYFIKNCLRVNCLQYDFVMWNDNVPIRIWEFIDPMPDYIIPIDFFKRTNM